MYSLSGFPFSAMLSTALLYARCLLVDKFCKKCITSPSSIEPPLKGAHMPKCVLLCSWCFENRYQWFACHRNKPVPCKNRIYWHTRTFDFKCNFILRYLFLKDLQERLLRVRTSIILHREHSLATLTPASIQITVLLVTATRAYSRWVLGKLCSKKMATGVIHRRFSEPLVFSLARVEATVPFLSSYFPALGPEAKHRGHHVLLHATGISLLNFLLK